MGIFELSCPLIRWTKHSSKFNQSDGKDTDVRYTLYQWKMESMVKFDGWLVRERRKRGFRGRTEMSPEFSGSWIVLQRFFRLSRNSSQFTFPRERQTVAILQFSSGLAISLIGRIIHTDMFLFLFVVHIMCFPLPSH